MTSRKKTQVIKARWQRTDIQAGLPTAAARAAFAWLMEHNTTYQEYIKNNKRLLAERHVDGDRWWMVPTAQLPMQMAGVEEAARPILCSLANAAKASPDDYVSEFWETEQHKLEDIRRQQERMPNLFFTVAPAE